MPNTKKKLIESLEKSLNHDGSGREMRFVGGDVVPAVLSAIAKGVRLEEKQSTSDETSKWIPVTEGLPKLIPCGAGTAYSEAVNVVTTGRKVLTAIWDGFDWICDAEFWDAEDEEITHWTPVLLPLPEPPKGE